MRVYVRLFTALRELAGKGEVTLDLNVDKATVGDVLRELVKKFGPKFSDYLFNEKAMVRDYLQLLVNGRSVDLLEGLKTRLDDGDVVAVVPPVGGG